MGIQALLDTQVLSVTGSTGDVMTVQADGSYLAAAPAGGGVGGSTGAVDNAVLRADGTGGVTLQTSAITIADLATASPNNTVNNVSMAPTGGTTNVSVSIVPKGTGAFCLAVPDGTSAGGNARGANSVDLQTARTTAAQVASGSYSFVAGYANTNSGQYGTALGFLNNVSGLESPIAIGDQCTTSGYTPIAIGYNCTASGSYGQGNVAIGRTAVANYSGEPQATAIGTHVSATNAATFASGSRTVADRMSMQAHSQGMFAAAGDAQSARFVLRKKTTDATPTTLMLNGSTTRLTIPSGKIMFADILISGIKSDGSAAACYKRKVAIKNVAGTTTLVGAVETIGTDIEDNAACDVAITADDTNDALQINVTGIAAETWRWVAAVEGLEIGYGT